MVATDPHTRDRRGRPPTSSPLIGKSTLLSPERNRSDSSAFRTPSANGYGPITAKSSTKSTDSATPRSAAKSGGAKDVDPFPTASTTSIGSGRSRTSEDKRLSGATLTFGDDNDDDYQLDAGMMLDALPGLVSVSKGVLANFAPSVRVPIEKLQKLMKNTKFSETISQQEKKFEREKKHFGPEHFIRVETAVEGLRPAGLRRKSELILHKANLARLALDVMRWLVGSVADPEPYLCRLNEWFPSFSTPLSDEESESNALQETLLAGLEIRTQYFLACLSNALNDDHGKSTDDILDDIFVWPSLSDDVYQGWNIDGLQDEDGQLPEKFNAVVADRMAAIRRALESNVFGRLKEIFPATKFTARLVKWIRSETDMIDAQLEDLDLDVVAARSKRELERPSSPSHQNIEPESAKHLEEKRSVQEVIHSRKSPEKEQLPDAEKASPKRSFGSKLNSRKMATRYRKSKSGQNMAAQQEQDSRDSGAEKNMTLQQEQNHSPAGEVVPPAGSEKLGDSNKRSIEDGLLDVFYDQGPLTEVKGPESTSRSNSKRTKDKSAAARPGSFLDRQDGARATSPINMDKPGERTSRKRGASELKDSDSPAFEEVDVAQNRGRAATKTRVRPDDDSDDYQPPPLNDDDDLGALNGFAAPPADPAPVKKRRRRALPNALGQTDDVFDIDATKESGDAGPSHNPVIAPRWQVSALGQTDDVFDIDAAKESGDAGPSHNPRRQVSALGQTDAAFDTDAVEVRGNPTTTRKTHVRVPWTIEEDDRLINFVKHIGTGWSDIERLDKKQPVPKLGRRNQNHCRYRARNLVVIFSNNNIPLPTNFEKVALNEVEKQKLVK